MDNVSKLKKEIDNYLNQSQQERLEKVFKKFDKDTERDIINILFFAIDAVKIEDVLTVLDNYPRSLNTNISEQYVEVDKFFEDICTKVLDLVVVRKS